MFNGGVVDVTEIIFMLAQLKSGYG